MRYVNKKFIFNWLTSLSLLLAGLSSVHGAKQAINIMLDDGSTIRVTRKDIFPNPPSQMIEDKDEVHIQIGSTHIAIDTSFGQFIWRLRATPGIMDRSKPFAQLIRPLRATAGVKSAILVMISPDERCENKTRSFDQTFLSSLSFPEKIQLLHKFFFSLLKYQKEGSKLAIEKIPGIQMYLGRVFVKSTKTLSTKEAIDPLREAVRIFAHAARAGYPTATANLHDAQHKLACALANSAQGSVKEISLLREAVELLTKNTNAGCQLAKKNLFIVQNNLAVALADSVQGSVEKISLLREAVELLTQSANARCQLAEKNLPIEQCKLGVMLAKSARNSANQILLLRESILFLTESAIAGDHYAKKALPMVQNNLGMALTNLAQGSPEETSLLREAIDLFTKSMIGGCQRARKKLSAAEHNLGIALANSTQGSVDEIPLLTEAIYLLENNANSDFQDPENQATLEQLRQRLAKLGAGVI